MTNSYRRLVAFAFVAGLAASIASSPLLADVQTSERTKQVGGKFMCMCNCSQVLTQCNHVGCTTSTAMLKEIDQGLANGGTEASVTQALVQEFGTKVYAEPPKSGLSLVAWSLPSVYLALGTVLVIFVIMRWRARPGHQVAVAGLPAGISSTELEKARQRVSRDTQD
jgi:cytochrome c-type biogenesis protein CcmH/NrfF